MSEPAYDYGFTNKTMFMADKLGAELKAFPLDFEARRTVATGSALAKICGVSKYGTMRDVLKREIARDTTTTEAMAYGSAKEPFLLEEWLEKNLQLLNLRVEAGYRLTLTMGEFRKHSSGVMGSTYDLVVYEDDAPAQCVDFKTTRHWWAEPPIDYIYQVGLQALILGLDQGELWVHSKKNLQSKPYTVTPSAVDWKQAEVFAREYLNYLDMGIVCP